MSAKKADGIIFLNQFAKKKILKLFDLKKKEHAIIPHGINKVYYNLNFKDYKNSEVRKIIYISPIDLYKHQWNVIKAINNLNNKGYNLSLHVVGSISNNLAKYKFFSSFSKKDNVIYHGELNEKKILKLLGKVDLYLFASSCESMGLTLLEGMATRLAVVCSNASGLPRTMNYKGFYFDPEDVNSIEKCLTKIVNNKKELIKNSNETRKISYNFNWKKSTKQTFNFLSKVFQKKVIKLEKRPRTLLP